MTSETREEQRTRILSSGTDTTYEEYDLALALGYEPESWDGMYKLPVHPFTLIGPFVIIREVRTDSNGKTLYDQMSNPRVKIKVRLIPSPKPW